MKSATSPLAAHPPGRTCLLCAVALFVSALTGAALAQGTVLTNDDVVKMTRAQLGDTVILAAINDSTAKFDLTPAALIALKEAAVSDRVIIAMQRRMRELGEGATTDSSTRSAPEKSELLASAKDPEFILRNFKTMVVDATHAQFFGSDQMKAALAKNKGFDALRITIVDDPAVADVVLTVGYTFAWDYPFSVKHQNTSLVLLSGKGTGPFSGPKGAASVASEFVKALKRFRTPARAGS